MSPTTLTTPLLALWLLALSAVAAGASPAVPWRVAPPGAWVAVARDVALETEPGVEEGESDFVFVDNQVRLSSVTSHYFRSMERLTNQAAVDRGAQISIEIDPEHERVLMHDVRVLRGGRAWDKLTGARRSLLNRETDLHEGKLNGRVTLHLLLNDVRVGDVLDYSYTLERRDPFGERGYSDWFSTQWSSPVRRMRLRLVNPVDRPLEIRDHGKLGKPERVRRDGWIETTWTGRDIAALHGEESRPHWFFYYPRIEASEFQSWDAVRAWAKPLYAVRQRDDAGLRELIAEVKAEPDDAARVLKALRFVQDDIRYTGLEIGAGAYRPSQPAEVLARRFGDCKDKTLLFITVLRELGIEAWPALVHSKAGRGTVQRAPSPGAFDHVIAKVRLGQKDYWVDATASGQGGNLDTLVQADYGPALVLDDTRHGLQLIPPRQALQPTHLVTETFDLRAGRDKAAKLTVRTVYREEDADAMRVKMRTTTAKALGKQYLDYYRNTYSGIRMVKPLATRDDRAKNQFVTTESYEIEKPFEREKGAWKLYLQAYLVTDRSKAPEPEERVSPLARSYPMHVRHEIVAYLSDGWNIEPDQVEIKDPTFEYRSKVSFDKGRLKLAYDLRNAMDHVPAGRLAEFRRKIDRVHDDAFFTLTDDGPTPAASTPDARAPLSGPSSQMLASLLVGLFGGGLLARALLSARSGLPAAHDDSAAGIDGWLLLPALITLLLPLFALYQVRLEFAEYGLAGQFAILDPLPQALHAGRLLVCGVLLVVSVTAACVLWRRRHSFPRLFHAQVVLLVMMSGADVALNWIARRFRMVDAELVGVVSVACVLLIACSAYLLWSQRVRATFVEPLDTRA